MTFNPSRVSPVQEFRDKPSKTNKDTSRRICSHDDCSVILSRYNLTSYCSVHEALYVSFKSLI